MVVSDTTLRIGYIICALLINIIHIQGDRESRRTFRNEEYYLWVAKIICTKLDYDSPDFMKCAHMLRKIIRPDKLDKGPLTENDFNRLLWIKTKLKNEAYNEAGFILKERGEPLYFEDFIDRECLDKLIIKYPQFDFRADIYIHAADPMYFYTAAALDLIFAALRIEKERAYPYLPFFEDTFGENLCRNLTEAQFPLLYNKVYWHSWQLTSKPPIQRPVDWFDHIALNLCPDGVCNECLKFLMQLDSKRKEIDEDTYKRLFYCSENMPIGFKNFAKDQGQYITFSNYTPPSCLKSMRATYPYFDFNEAILSSSLSYSLLLSQQVNDFATLALMYYYYMNPNIPDLYINITCQLAVEKYLIELAYSSPQSFNKSVVIKPPRMPPYSVIFCAVAAKYQHRLPASTLDTLANTVCNQDVCKHLVKSIFFYKTDPCLRGVSTLKISSLKYDPNYFHIQTKISLLKYGEKFSFTLLPQWCLMKLEKNLSDFNVSRSLVSNFSETSGNHLLDISLLRTFTIIMTFLHINNMKTLSVNSLELCEKVAIKEADILLNIDPDSFNKTKFNQSVGTYPSILQTLEFKKENLESVVKETIRYSGCKNIACYEKYQRFMQGLKSFSKEISPQAMQDYLKCEASTSQQFRDFINDKNVSFGNQLPGYCLRSLQAKYPLFNFNITFSHLIPNVSHLFIQYVTVHEAMFMLFAAHQFSEQTEFSDLYCKVVGSIIEGLKLNSNQTFHRNSMVTVQELTFNDSYSDLVAHICFRNEQCLAFFNKLTCRSLKQITKSGDYCYDILQVLLMTSFNRQFTVFAKKHMNAPLTLQQTFGASVITEVKKLNKFIRPESVAKTHVLTSPAYSKIIQLVKFQYSMVGFYCSQTNATLKLGLVQKLQREDFFLYLCKIFDSFSYSVITPFTEGTIVYGRDVE